MGNVVQCCHTLSNYFKCKEAPAQVGAESSPLLSSEESEYDSLTLLDNLDDDLFNVSTGVPNTAMEQEHLLFPDIILSSHFAGDAALVDPMVCLLVSEEEEAGGDGLRIGQERSDRGRYFEVETQTEVETQIGMGVQTEPQAEVQTQTEILVCHDEAEERATRSEANTQTRTETVLDFWEGHEILNQVDVQFEAEVEKSPELKRKNQVMTAMLSDKKLNSRTWFDVEIFAKSKPRPNVEKEKERTTVDTETEPGELTEIPIQEETLRTHTVREVNTACGQNKSDLQKASAVMDLTPSQENTNFPWTESRILQTRERVKEQEQRTETKRTSVMLTGHAINSVDENIAAVESGHFLLTKHNISAEIVENCDMTEDCADLTKKRNENNDQMTQGGVVSDRDVSEKDYIICKKAELDLFGDDRKEAAALTQQDGDHMRSNTALSESKQSEMERVYSQSVFNTHPENLHPVQRRENDSTTSLQAVSELATAPLQVEEAAHEAEMKHTTLSLFDSLFLASPHVKAIPSQIGEGHKHDGSQHYDANKMKRDIADLQETCFPVRIQAPEIESFELQVSGQMLVEELRQMLMDHQLMCHRTCFSLQLGGATLDNVTELRSIEGIQESALIKVVEDSYTVRDARLHLRHVRDLLRSLDPTDAYNGVNGRSLSYLTFHTKGETDSEGAETVHCSPPEYVLPGCKDHPLTPLQPVRDDWKPLQCLRVLTMSSWNPPPGNRKMHGDLMYLNVVTMEDREFIITSSTRGFYINQSTAFNFNPKPAAPKILCHALVELLSQVSPAFRKNFSALQRKRVQQHPYERIAAPFQVFTWIVPQEDHTLDCIRPEETHTSRMGQDEHTAGQSRDWNEELQGSRELPKNTLQERLQRDRSMFKTNSDFVSAATQGAIAVIDGNIMPLNPGEAFHTQMFIWNNIFFSLGFDASDHFSPLGGNAAAHAAATCDLRGAQAYASVDTEGLHTLGTAVVDFRGIRVIAQTIVPGLLEKNLQQSVVYGSIDYGKTVFTHQRFLELLDKSSGPLRIQRHQVLDHNHTPVELCSGIETKGILGNDGRPYILDLLRTFPPDLNFQYPEIKDKEEVPQECHRLGFPQQHPHSLASLRPELVDTFIQHTYDLYGKTISLEPNQLETNSRKAGNSAKIVAQAKDRRQNNELAGEKEAGEADTADIELRRRNVLMLAYEADGSMRDNSFNIRFNPDVCTPGVCFPSECADEVQIKKRLLWEAAAFLLSNQIPAVLRDCLNHTAVPMDGTTLTSVLHQRGVNIRYVGTLLRELNRMEEKGRLSHVQKISISELIIRSAKHIFKLYLQDVEPPAFSAAVSHFLNCLLSSSNFPDYSSDELLSKRRSRRRRSHGGRVAQMADSVWGRLTPSELWRRIRTEAEDYYHYTIDSESIDEVIENYGLQRISLLREIAIKTGIQVQLREYVFESRHRPVFSDEDVNMFPVVKHLKPKATDATRLVQQAQEAVQQGLLTEGYEMISQALNLFSSVCGVLHEDVCTCLRLLGRLNYILGNYADALSHQEKAVLSSERVKGIDHPQTIQDYTHLALYCFAGGRHATSLRLLYRARYLTLVVGGEDHPHVALLDSMLGLILHGMMEYELSLKFLQNALILSSKCHGATSMKHAHSHHLLANVYESKGEFRSALQHEKEAYLIYKSQVGENQQSTTQSSEYLKSLTEQAVNLQKAINHIYRNTPSACVPPPKFSIPSLPAILQQLNLTCGIISIPLRADRWTQLEVKENVRVEELDKLLLKAQMDNIC